VTKSLQAGQEQSPASAEPPRVVEVKGDADHADLYHWHRNVGEPLALDLAPPLSAMPAEVTVLSWNLAIGAARLVELVGRLRSGEHALPFDAAAAPLVILAQEAYREEAALAPTVGRYHGGLPFAERRTDVRAMADELGMSLRYVPSMRNGASPSDRGNAIFSSAALNAGRGFLLPFVRQRRVIVAAEWAGWEALSFVSAHLDTGGRSRVARFHSERGFGSGRRRQAWAIADWLQAAGGNAATVVGADLNTPLGERDPAFRAILRGGFVPGRRARVWRHTFHGPLRLRLPLDFIIARPADVIVDVEVHRIDEHPRDRGARIFGSDHHPLLARVRLRPDALQAV
jgi:endonuclease/exonuclease/phosphatase family metal-dependent hydrolase